MRLEQTPRPENTLRVSARLITSSTILHLSADELEQTVSQEQTENPALEVAEQRICLFCGASIYSQTCTICGHAVQATRVASQEHETLPAPESSEPVWSTQGIYDTDNSGFAEIDSADDNDPLAHLPTRITLSETLLQHLEALISPDDAEIAEQLVGNLNERGYLEIGPQEIAEHLQVTRSRVDFVLEQLQGLEPLGIGARDLRECLLIQLKALSEPAAPPPLVFTLIDHHLNALARSQFHEIARQLQVTEKRVREAYHYIRTMLHPFPAHIYRGTSPFGQIESGATYIHPDVVIRQGDNGFEVELIEEKRYSFHINTAYPINDERQQLEHASKKTELLRYMHHHRDRAKFFVDCIYRRWRTLKRVAELVVAYQQGFLQQGVRALRPLTRAEIAARLGLDEGTVSRATANKYALLPDGRLIPFSDFFDGSLSIKHMLREIIQAEQSKHRLSDEELARQLSERGIPLARRTVTKYREEMGIGSSRERGQNS